MFVRFPSCGILTPTRTSPVKQRVETTGLNQAVQVSEGTTRNLHIHVKYIPLGIWYMGAGVI